MVAKVDLVVNQTWNPYKAGGLFRLTPLPNLNPTKDFEMGLPIGLKEVVLVFRPVCSQLKVDQGFI